MFFEAPDVAELAARLPDAPRIDFPDNGHPLAMERPEAIVTLFSGSPAELLEPMPAARNLSELSQSTFTSD